MKKIAALLISAALLLCTCTSVFAANIGVNGGTVIKSSVEAAGTQVEANAFDGNRDTYWQAATNKSGEYVGKLFDRTYEITAVSVIWGGGYSGENDYEVQITKDGGQTWSKVGTAPTRSDLGNSHWEDPFTFNAVTANGVRVYMTKDTSKSSFQIWEVEITGTPADGGIVPGGVESVAIYVVLFALAAAVIVFNVRKANA